MFYSDIKQGILICLWLFQTEISAMLEVLRKKLRMLNKTKEHWEETKNFIRVKKNKWHVIYGHFLWSIYAEHFTAESIKWHNI